MCPAGKKKEKVSCNYAFLKNDSLGFLRFKHTYLYIMFLNLFIQMLIFWRRFSDISGVWEGEYSGEIAMWRCSLWRNRDTTLDSVSVGQRDSVRWVWERSLTSLWIFHKFTSEPFVICVVVVISTNKLRVWIYVFI